MPDLTVRVFGQTTPSGPPLHAWEEGRETFFLSWI